MNKINRKMEVYGKIIIEMNLNSHFQMCITHAPLGNLFGLEIVRFLIYFKLHCLKII